jgi:hypothetical protein
MLMSESMKQEKKNVLSIENREVVGGKAT